MPKNDDMQYCPCDKCCEFNPFPTALVAQLSFLDIPEANCQVALHGSDSTDEQFWGGMTGNVQLGVSCNKSTPGYHASLVLGATCYGDTFLSVSCRDPIRMEGDFVMEGPNNPPSCDGAHVHVVITE